MRGPSAVAELVVTVVVVDGLAYFEVGLSNVFPYEGNPVKSFSLCGKHESVVHTGKTITVECAKSAQKFRYVIVRSSKKTHLCMAEVAVFAAC